MCDSFEMWHDSGQIRFLCDMTHSRCDMTPVKFVFYVTWLIWDVTWLRSYMTWLISYVAWLVHLSTGWRRLVGCLNLQVFFWAKEPLIIGLFGGKWPIKIKHPMTPRHPVRRRVHVCGTARWLNVYKPGTAYTLLPRTPGQQAKSSIEMCDTTHSYVWHDPFICDTWLIQMYGMTSSHVWHDSCSCTYVTQPVHMCGTTRWSNVYTPGTAYTFFTATNAKATGKELLRILTENGQEIPPEFSAVSPPS